MISINVYLACSICAIKLIRKHSNESSDRMRMLKKSERKKCLRRNKFVYNWNLVIHPYNLLVVSVCGAISNVIFNLFFVFVLFAVCWVRVRVSVICTPHALAPMHVRTAYREPSENISMGQDIDRSSSSSLFDSSHSFLFCFSSFFTLFFLLFIFHCFLAFFIYSS